MSDKIHDMEFYQKMDRKINGPPKKEKVKLTLRESLPSFSFVLFVLLMLVSMVVFVNAQSHFYDEIIYTDTGLKFIESKNYLSGSIFNKDSLLIEDSQFTIIKSSVFSDEMITLPFRKVKEVILEESSWIYKLTITQGEGMFGTTTYKYYLCSGSNFDTLSYFLEANKDKYIYTTKKTTF